MGLRACLEVGRMLSMLAVACILAGCYPKAGEADEEQRSPHFIEGKRKINERDYTGALDSFQREIEVNPRSVMAHFALGTLYEQRMNDPLGAIYHYRRVLQLRPDEYPADHAKLRMQACEQELVKSAALSPMAQKMVSEIERLKFERQQLEQELAGCRDQAAKLMAATAAVFVATAPPANTDARAVSSQPVTPRREPAQRAVDSPRDRARTAGTTGSTGAAEATEAVQRSHRVKERETMVQIARKHGVTLRALQTANPKISPERLRVGQVLVVPSP